MNKHDEIEDLNQEAMARIIKEFEARSNKEYPARFSDLPVLGNSSNPKDYKDSLKIFVDVDFSWTDRIKILWGAIAKVIVEIETENEIGNHQAQSEIIVYSPQISTLRNETHLYTAPFVEDNDG